MRRLAKPVTPSSALRLDTPHSALTIKIYLTRPTMPSTLTETFPGIGVAAPLPDGIGTVAGMLTLDRPAFGLALIGIGTDRVP